jgi:hypothetical protein
MAGWDLKIFDMVNYLSIVTAAVYVLAFSNSLSYFRFIAGVGLLSTVELAILGSPSLVRMSGGVSGGGVMICGGNNGGDTHAGQGQG